MIELIKTIKFLQGFAPSLGGVFSLSDIKTVFRNKSAEQTSKILTMLDEGGILKRFMRGFYYMPDNFDVCVLSQKICPKSVISFEKALSDNALIDPIPVFEVSAIKSGPTRVYKDEAYTIRHYSISTDLIFGFEYRNAIAFADSEKALIDLLYFYQKGRKPLVNLKSGIEYGRINQKKIITYLDRYRNPRFVSFVKNCIAGKI
jgi:predicted transcriptional regulator of viral defense system